MLNCSLYAIPIYNKKRYSMEQTDMQLIKMISTHYASEAHHQQGFRTGNESETLLTGITIFRCPPSARKI